MAVTGEPITRPPLEPRRLASLLAGAGPRPGGDWRVGVEEAAASTNATLAGEARAGAAEGVVLVVEHQTAGRGRLDRVWQTPPRSALTFSALLRPPVPAQDWPWLPLLAGLAVADALGDVLGAGAAGLKWPNDVLVAERKICGILLERVETPTGPAAVLGVGLNTGLSEAELALPTATSVRLETGAEPDRTALLAGLLHALGGRYAAWCAAGGAATLRGAYTRACVTLGREVRVEMPTGPPLTGTAESIDGSGRLVVVDGARHVAVGAGDVVHVRATGGPGVPRGPIGPGQRRPEGETMPGVGFPSRLLNDGERVVVSTRTHPKALVLPLVLVLVVAALTAVALGLVSREMSGTPERFVSVVIGVVALAALLRWALVPAARWATTSYTFTDRRFISRSGFIAKEGRTIPLNRISGVDFDIDLSDRVFGCGTLVVSDASEQGRVELPDIPRVEHVQLLVAEELHRLHHGTGRRGDEGT